MTQVMPRVPSSIVLRRPVTQFITFKAYFASKFSSSSRTDPILYFSPIDAEPLHRYRKGGYRPVALGHVLKEGRYKVLHKLGWGGYSTVWAAKDQRFYWPTPT